MKKIYLDITKANSCTSVFLKDAEVIFAGTTVNAMSVKHKNSEYRRFDEEYGIRFIFEDNIPTVDFYTIPMVEIFAVDNTGGFIGSVGKSTDLQEDIPTCYIDAEKNCYLIAENGEELLKKVQRWKDEMTPYNAIEFFESLEAAQEKYEFLDRDKFS